MNLIQLQPDDVLVLRCPGSMGQAQRDAALAGLRDYLGPDLKVIFLDAGETLDVLRGVAVPARAKDDQPTTTGEGHRQVQHVDTDEPEATGIPPHVWLYRNMLTDQQAVAPLGRDETNGQYAVAIDGLTDDQRAIPHIKSQLQGHDILCRDNLRYVDTADRAAQDRLDSMMRAQLEDLQKDNTSI